MYPHVTQVLLARGFVLKTVPVRGRFHSLVHAEAANKIAALFNVDERSQFPRIDQLHAPVRSAVDGMVIDRGSLLQHALENTFLEPLDWHRLLTNTFDDSEHARRNVIGFGVTNPVPPSLRRTMELGVTRFESWISMQPNPLTQPQLQGVGEVSASEHATSGGNDSSPSGRHAPEDFPPHSVAIVGMAGRFPGAETPEELWKLMADGTSTVEAVPAGKYGLDSQFDDEPRRQWWGNLLRNPECFDHEFFKKSPREAQAWDPQQRIALEVAYQALESSGYFGTAAASRDRDYGCFIGAVMNNYYDNVSCHRPTAYATLGTSRCFISGAISHFFGWTGPAISMDTACSLSLVAINAACKAIMAGECSRAIAGGTNVITSPYDYRNLAAAGFLSPTGQCKPFDADADGYCGWSGRSQIIGNRNPGRGQCSRGDRGLGSQPEFQ